MSEKSQKVEITNKAFDKYVSFLTRKERAEIAATAKAQENARMQKIVEKLQEDVRRLGMNNKELSRQLKELDDREKKIQDTIDFIEDWSYQGETITVVLKEAADTINGLLTAKDKITSLNKLVKKIENLY